MVYLADRSRVDTRVTLIGDLRYCGGLTVIPKRTLTCSAVRFGRAMTHLG